MNREQVIAWREAAVKDEWLIAPLWTNVSTDTAARLTKEGFVCQIYSTNNFSVAVWGADGLAVDVPDVYSWDIIKDNLTRCTNCHQIVSSVRRLAFAGRVCEPCFKLRAPIDMRLGWYN